MRREFLKGLKQILIKRLALLIGICYLLHPLNDQLNHVLHAISHGIEMPDNIIEHKSIVVPDDHLHDQHLHEALSENHEHVVLTTIALLFGTSDDHEGSNENIPGQLKIDKHIASSSYQRLPYFFLQVEHVFLNPFKRTREGHKRTKENPPRNFLS